MNIVYKIFNPLTGIHTNLSDDNSIKLLAIDVYKSLNSYSYIKKVYTTEDNIEIIKPYENNLY